MNVEVKTKEQLREETLAKIASFKIMDDTFMTAFFNEKPELAEFVLRIILNMEHLKVKSSKVQKVLKSIQGRSITLDIDAIDEDGRECDIEFQQENKGAKPKRARFHSSMIDSNALMISEDFDKLPESYVIFITSEDYFGLGLPIYTIDRYIKEADMKPFGDDAHIIYVNGENTEDTPLGKLVHDFKCTNPKDMYFKQIADRADQLKNTEGGHEEMCRIMEEISAENVRQEKYQIAMNLIRMGLGSLEDIAKATDLTVEEVQALEAMVKTSA